MGEPLAMLPPRVPACRTGGDAKRRHSSASDGASSVSVAQASRDLDVHANVLRKWVRELAADPGHAFPGHGQMKPEQMEIDRLRRELAKLKAERDILKKAAAYFARDSI